MVLGCGYLAYCLTAFCHFSLAQGLWRRHVDMIEDGVCGSSVSITKVYDTLRHSCISAIKHLERRKKMKIGGRNAFVVIDESKFRHKRKVQQYE